MSDNKYFDQKTELKQRSTEKSAYYNAKSPKLYVLLLCVLSKVKEKQTLHLFCPNLISVLLLIDHDQGFYRDYTALYWAQKQKTQHNPKPKA